MTQPKRSRQPWGRLYLLALMMIGLLFLAHRLAPSPGWRTFLEIGVVVIGYGLIIVWLEIHPDMLLSRLPDETDNPAVEPAQVETPAPEPASARYRLYAGYRPALIYGGPEQPTEALRLNGNHHLAEPLPPYQSDPNPKQAF
jgi:hypothetical protein